MYQTKMKQFIKFYASVLMVTVFAVSTCFAQKASDRYAILIGGSGWSEEYSAKYKKYFIDTRKALIENFGFSELHVLMLTESITETDRQFISMSHAEFIREEFTLLAEDISTDAVVFVILFGHGSFDGKHGKFNIPGKDLTDADFAGLIDKLAADRIVFITTTQASFPFIQTLSEKNRIIITGLL